MKFLNFRWYILNIYVKLIYWYIKRNPEKLKACEYVFMYSKQQAKELEGMDWDRVKFLGRSYTYMGEIKEDLPKDYDLRIVGFGNYNDIN